MNRRLGGRISSPDLADWVGRLEYLWREAEDLTRSYILRRLVQIPSPLRRIRMTLLPLLLMIAWVQPVESQSVTVESRVSASSDDAEERSSGSVNLTSSDLELVDDGSRRQTVGMRFKRPSPLSGRPIPGRPTVLKSSWGPQTPPTRRPRRRRQTTGPGSALK